MLICMCSLHCYYLDYHYRLIGVITVSNVVVSVTSCCPLPSALPSPRQHVAAHSCVLGGRTSAPFAHDDVTDKACPGRSSPDAAQELQRQAGSGKAAKAKGQSLPPPPLSPTLKGAGLLETGGPCPKKERACSREIADGGRHFLVQKARLLAGLVF